MTSHKVNWLNKTKQTIEEGKIGLNSGFSFRLGGNLSKHISIIPGSYYLIAALSNVGKSAFMYDQFIFNMHDKALKGGFNVHVDVYTPEISPTAIIGKAMCYWLFTRKGILTTPSVIFSKGDYTIPVRIEKMINSDECVNYIESLLERVTFYTYLSLSTIRKNTLKRLKTTGETIIENGNVVHYAPHNKKDLYMVAVDHIGIAQPERGHSIKATIDSISTFLYAVRTTTKLIPVVVQQITPSRDVTPEQQVLPGHLDIRDSKNPYQDCDIMIGIGNPFTAGLSTYRGYTIVNNGNSGAIPLKRRFRVVNIIKNRDGEVNILTPAFFYGEIGYYGYLPVDKPKIHKKIMEKFAITE